MSRALNICLKLRGDDWCVDGNREEPIKLAQYLRREEGYNLDSSWR